MSKFYVGQRVVCIDKSTGKRSNIKIHYEANKYLELNKIYVVIDLYKSPCCGNYFVYVGFDVGLSKTMCACGVIDDKMTSRMFHCEARFAPLQEYTDSLSIANEFAAEDKKVEKPVKQIEKVKI